MTDNEIIKAKELIKKLEEAYNAYFDTSKGMPYDIDKTLRETAICLENAIAESDRQKAEVKEQADLITRLSTIKASVVKDAQIEAITDYTKEGGMKETRYVLCDSCGSKIYLGSEVYCFDGYCGVYCSAECYADAHATIKVLDEDEADNCGCDILDDNAIEKEKAEIEKKISALQGNLGKLNKLTDTPTEKGGE